MHFYGDAVWWAVIISDQFNEGNQLLDKIY